MTMSRAAAKNSGRMLSCAALKVAFCTSTTRSAVRIGIERALAGQLPVTRSRMLPDPESHHRVSPMQWRPMTTLTRLTNRS